MTPGGASLPCSPRPSVLGRLPLRAARVPGAVPAARQAPSRRRCSKPPLPSQPHPRCPGERTGGEGPGRIHSLAGERGEAAAPPEPRSGRWRGEGFRQEVGFFTKGGERDPEVPRAPGRRPPPLVSPAPLAAPAPPQTPTSCPQGSLSPDSGPCSREAPRPSSKRGLETRGR